MIVHTDVSLWIGVKGKRCEGRNGRLNNFSNVFLLNIVVFLKMYTFTLISSDPNTEFMSLLNIIQHRSETL